MILGGAAIVQVKGGFGGRSSFSRSYSRPSYSKPSYSPSYKRSTTTNNHTTIIQQNSGGGSNGLLWGLGGYFLGQHAANASKCQ
ncbi:hypothetical protein [Neorhizobium sp. S3-V5DH]|uniref:hypothetical protein n=1 Tax=Neorhizobium sp. S3-V5DH TaxID=2485166 RepID=UPI0010445FB2|nr:hypothetical protein [Neorhizobium sp. S3-V5DH]